MSHKPDLRAIRQRLEEARRPRRHAASMLDECVVDLRALLNHTERLERELRDLRGAIVQHRQTVWRDQVVTNPADVGLYRVAQGDEA